MARSAVLIVSLLILSICFYANAARFAIIDRPIGELDTKRMINLVTGEYAEVVVDFGGRVEELYLKPTTFNGKLQKVLLSHNGNATAIKENKWWMGMFLVPWANRIAYGKYTFYNDTHQLPLNENSVDPSRHNALHGLLAGKKLAVESQRASDENAQLHLSYISNGEQGYPFSWKYDIIYTLSDNSFVMNIIVTSMMALYPLPLYIGWHPYFACTAYSAFVIFDKETKWNHIELNSNLNPTGISQFGSPFDGNNPIGGTPSNPTVYDDEYKATSTREFQVIKTKLLDPVSKKTVVLSQSPNMKFVHVFTGSTAGFGEGSIAMEPMSGMADAYNNHDGLSILSGEEIWEASFGVHLE